MDDPTDEMAFILANLQTLGQSLSGTVSLRRDCYCDFKALVTTDNGANEILGTAFT